MARKTPTKDPAPWGWKKRLATDIELQELLFNLPWILVFLVIPATALMWNGDTLCVVIAASACLAIALVGWWALKRARHGPGKTH